ncbi:hypothetical protein BLNAU_9220 [Blattamonas nauphoetae]|uniref:Anaphase-promoting complex subunit 1 n=1 Tax=Blattamonas nauphoetae TaxID=2049346 RepID=A0ABQ9XWL8_9EUKA|nr:hypothetical protein BLNAU_9220 [Blattamonas nauphoetae]
MFRNPSINSATKGGFFVGCGVRGLLQTLATSDWRPLTHADDTDLASLIIFGSGFSFFDQNLLQMSDCEAHSIFEHRSNKEPPQSLIDSISSHVASFHTQWSSSKSITPALTSSSLVALGFLSLSPTSQTLSSTHLSLLTHLISEQFLIHHHPNTPTSTLISLSNSAGLAIGLLLLPRDGVIQSEPNESEMQRDPPDLFDSAPASDLFPEDRSRVLSSLLSLYSSLFSHASSPSFQIGGCITPSIRTESDPLADQSQLFSIDPAFASYQSTQTQRHLTLHQPSRHPEFFTIQPKSVSGTITTPIPVFSHTSPPSSSSHAQTPLSSLSLLDDLLSLPSSSDPADQSLSFPSSSQPLNLATVSNAAPVLLTSALSNSTDPLSAVFSAHQTSFLRSARLSDPSVFSTDQDSETEDTEEQMDWLIDPHVRAEQIRLQHVLTLNGSEEEKERREGIEGRWTRETHTLFELLSQFVDKVKVPVPSPSESRNRQMLAEGWENDRENSSFGQTKRGELMSMTETPISFTRHAASLANGVITSALTQSEPNDLLQQFLTRPLRLTHNFSRENRATAVIKPPTVPVSIIEMEKIGIDTNRRAVSSTLYNPSVIFPRPSVVSLLHSAKTVHSLPFLLSTSFVLSTTLAALRTDTLAASQLVSPPSNLRHFLETPPTLVLLRQLSADLINWSQLRSFSNFPDQTYKAEYIISAIPPSAYRLMLVLDHRTKLSQQQINLPLLRPQQTTSNHNSTHFKAVHATISEYEDDSKFLSSHQISLEHLDTTQLLAVCLAAIVGRIAAMNVKSAGKNERECEEMIGRLIVWLFDEQERVHREEEKAREIIEERRERSETDEPSQWDWSISTIRSILEGKQNNVELLVEPQTPLPKKPQSTPQSLMDTILSVINLPQIPRSRRKHVIFPQPRLPHSFLSFVTAFLSLVLCINGAGTGNLITFQIIRLLLHSSFPSPSEVQSLVSSIVNRPRVNNSLPLPPPFIPSATSSPFFSSSSTLDPLSLFPSLIGMPTKELLYSALGILFLGHGQEKMSLFSERTLQVAGIYIFLSSFLSTEREGDVGLDTLQTASKELCMNDTLTVGSCIHSGYNKYDLEEANSKIECEAAHHHRSSLPQPIE